MVDFTIKQGDTSPAIEATLKNNTGNAVNLTGASVQFHLSTSGVVVNESTGVMVPTPETVKINSAATIADASAGKVKYEWQSGDTADAGDLIGEWQVTYADGSIETFPNDNYISIKIKREIA